MALACLLLLLAPEEALFTIPERLPGWTKAAPDPDHPAIRASFRTEMAEIRVTVGPGTLEAWKERARGMFGEVSKEEGGKGTLGGQECVLLDLRGKREGHALRVTSRLARRGGRMFELAVIRWDDLLDDEEIDEDAAKVVAAFAFLVEPDPEPAPETAPESAPAPPSPPEPRREVRLDFWKLRCVKPEGMVEVPASGFDDAERRAGVVLRFQGERPGSRLVARVYAQSRKTERWHPIERLLRERIDQFEREEAAQRAEPEVGDRWKLPLAEETRTLRLSRIRQGKEVNLWWFAECSNGRQYQLQLFVSGGDGERTWRKEIAEIVEGLVPVR